MFDTEIYNEKFEQLLDEHFIMDSRPVRENVHSVHKKLEKFTDGLSDDGTAYSVLQGGCYVSSRDHFFFAIGNKKHLNVVVMEVKSDFETVVKKLVLPLGHANDFTYNPKENRIYVTTGSTGKLANKIAIIDLDKWDTAKKAKDIFPYTYGIVSEMQTPEYILLDNGTISKWQCSYDVINDKYYVNDSKHLKVYDGDWNLLKSFPNKFKEHYKGLGQITTQSSFCYNGKFVFVTFSKEEFSGALQITGIYLHTINSDTGETESISRYSPTDPSEEPEFVDVVGDIAYMFSGHTYYRVSKLYLNKKELYPLMENVFKSPKLITETWNDDWNTTSPKESKYEKDLNNMLIPGVYYSPNADHTSTIKNIPVTKGFTLYISPIGRGNIMQKVIDTTGMTYQRIFDVSDGFSSWTLVDGCDNGARFRRDKENTTNVVTLNKRGACFVILCISSGANLYFINSSGEKAYVKTLVTQIPGVTTSKSGNKVTFKSSQKVTMFVWTMA